MKKRVLFLAHSALRGGAEFCLDVTLRHLNRENVEPYAIFPTDGPMADSARQMGIPVEIVPLSWWMLYEPSFWEWKNRLRIPFRLHFLKRFILRNGIQTVYSNTACLFEGVLAARAAGVPHVTHIHEVLEDAFMRPRWLSIPKIVRFFCAHSQNVIFESESALQIARRQLESLALRDVEKLSRKLTVVSNSSRLTLEDAQEFSASCEEKAWQELAKYGLKSDRRTLLWMGRFSERKNPFMLLAAVEKLLETRSPAFRNAFQVLFVGAGPLEEPLRHAIEARSLRDVCRLVPFQEDVRPLLRLADALVLTSREESFGLVLVEAGMFALPVIAVRSQGPAEIIREGETGFLVDSDSVEELSTRIASLFQDEDLRQTMGLRNQQRVLEFFDPIKNTQKIEQLL